jgi:hypothetical protein
MQISPPNKYLSLNQKRHLSQSQSSFNKLINYLTNTQSHLKIFTMGQKINMDDYPELKSRLYTKIL